MYNLVLKNFDSSFNVLKLILPAGNASRTPLLITIFNQYNFDLYNDFFDQFNKLTSFLSSDILLPVFLYLPDSDSTNNTFSFYIKSPTSYFLLKKLIHNPKSLKISDTSCIIFLNIIDLFKISLIKSIFLSIIIPGKFKFQLNSLRKSFLSLKGQLRSIQSISLNEVAFSNKQFFIYLYL